ncbi:MAG TPA: lysophospholipid acyltransferase family protein [Acidimicrobiales bacterium]|nr:lysophospholipid acyltransferase family protein [Acidimicrobiales bacterium]
MTSLPGSTPPKRKVPVNLERLRDGGPAAWARAASRLRPRPSTFPFGPPTWPTSVPRPPLERHLGVAYDTSWARRPPARVARLLVTELLTTPAMRALARPEVRGLDRLASLDEPVVFAANHASHVDTPLVLSVLPEPWRHRTVVAGAADYFFDTRAKAAASALVIGAVPIERTRISRASTYQLQALLADRWSLVIFPEGGRSPDGWGRPHEPGAAWLAVRAGVAVVPLHIEGTRRVLPRGTSRPSPGRTTVTFGRPLRAGDGVDARALAVELEAAIAALADEATGDWYSARRRAAAGASPRLTGPDAVGAWRRSWALGPGGRSGRASAPAPGGRRWPKL